MAKVKIALDRREGHKHNDGRCPVVLRISHKSKTRDIPFDIYVLENDFDSETYDLKGIQNAVRQTKRVKKKIFEVDLWVDENKAVVKLWDIAKLKDQIERKFFNKQSELTLFSHACDLFARFYTKEKFSTISSYEDALKIFAKFNMARNGKSDRVIIKSLFEIDGDGRFTLKSEYEEFDLPIKAINKELAKNFEAYLSARLKSRNSVAIHLRSIQAIIGDAEDSFDELKDHKPFRGIKKSSRANNQVVLTYDEINQIRSLREEFKLACDPKFDVINYFLFMFNNMGMNFNDLVRAKVSNYDGERFNYLRKKTENETEGDFFSILQNEENLEIIQHYVRGKSKDDYLFPILKPDISKERIFRVKNYKGDWFNKHFNGIAEKLSIDKNITTYTARDTWANLALEMGVDIRSVQKGLGHTTVETTEKHYEKKQKQFSLLDEVNSWVTGMK
ncbi:MAG: tyrosine-type recombinase/integrase [Cytophagales bacterium]|nr:tyrosine-type recombinase/integrase [Cytophagales bacterium]